jgi:hypothetical protein
MASLYSFLQSSLSGGEVHDYAHAAQIFRTNNFARAPKYKYLFYVNFVLSSEVPSYIDASEIGYLVKSVELPKFTMDVKDLNQYNRHVYIQDRIKYEPVTIKFHDDNNNGLRELWQNYYNYYYADGQYSSNDYNYDDRYQTRLHSSWGLDNGSDVPFFSAVEIYSMYGGQSNKITLMSPVITTFNHDTHEYAENTGVMEATMQLRYNGVTYEDGFVDSIPGFNEGANYDTNLSGLTGSLIGNFIDPVTGVLTPQTDGFINPVQTRKSQQTGYGFINQGAQYNPSSNTGLTDIELTSIAKNNASVAGNGGTIFPTADISPPTYSQNVPDVQPVSNADLSNKSNNPDNTSVSTNGTTNPYTVGSYQYALYNQGYNTTQINSATQFVGSVSPTALTQYQQTNNLPTSIQAQTVISQQYIDNPASVSDIGSVNYGQPNAVASNIDFSNPALPAAPVYNSNSWQNTLLAQGYTQSDIAVAATQISKLNVAPGTDLVTIAKSYISYSKNQVV